MYALFAIAAASAILITTNASRLTPPVLPLVVRTPYLSLWLNDARENPWNRWPMFWTGQEIGFSILAAVPETGNVYPLLGRPHDSLLPQREEDPFNVSYATYVGSKYDASTTNLTYLIPKSHSSDDSAPLELILSFLSPITPTSTLRQSIPASYLTVHVKGSFNVDIYVDLNGQWVSGDRGSFIRWDFAHQELGGSNVGLKTWTVERHTNLLFSEFRDQAEWGTLHFTAPSDVRHECGTSALLRRQFSRTGTLQNTVDGEYRTIMDEEPVFAFARSFKLNSSSSASSPRSESVLFTIAHTQDPVTQFAASRGLTFMRPLWASWFSTAEKLLSFHYSDFKNAFKLAREYSLQLEKDAYKSGSHDYVDIVALSARQVMGASTFVGTPDNPIIFQKELSSSGNVQTLDVLFPSFPFFLYTNPRWLAYSLEPILEHTLSGQYPNKYAPHDIGYHYPNATGHPDGREEYMPVEECGDVLVLGLAIINSLRYETSTAAGSVWSSLGRQGFDANPATSAFSLNELETREDIFGLDDSWGGSIKGEKQAKKWVERSYRLWKQWTQYLIDYSLEPSHQLSTDDFAGPLQLQTNLALKGVLGIKAMSQIAEVFGNADDVKYYKNISDVYISKWEEFGISRDGTHAKLAYNWYGSWTTLYNLYIDSLLCFHLEGTTSTSSPTVNREDQKPLAPGHPEQNESNKTGFVPRRVYKIQSDWYHAVRQRYGLPLDSRHMYTKTDWEFFAAAVTSESVREEILQSVALWVNETSTDRPFVDLHDTEGTGGFPSTTFMARPVVGDTGNYFSSHQQQEFVPFEDGEGLYQNENGNTHLGLGQSMQPSKQNSMTSGINTPHDQLHTRLHDLIKHQVQPRPSSKFEEQERASNAAGDGTSQKPDVSALNDRAAELRARLLANRSSTPGTPSNQTGKSSDPMKPKTNDGNLSLRQINDSNSTEASAVKTAGHTVTQSLGGTKNADKSPNKAQTSSSERADATTDIDGLFAEARAAVAAEKPMTGENSGQGGSTAKNLKGSVNDSPSKGTSSETGQHDTKAGGHRHSLNKSTSSSETSELGEIRSDSGKTSSVVQPSEPVNGKAIKEGGRPVDEKSKHQTHASNGLEKQSTKRVDGDSQNRQAHPTSSTKTSASSPTASQLRDQPQSSRNDYRRDRYDRPSLNQEPRKEHEQDRRRDLDLKERNTDSRRSSAFRTYGHDSERGRSDYQVDMETRRPQNIRYDVEESARAAAEYKKELEDRRRQASRVTFDRADSAKDPSKKEVDAVGPRTPKARVVEASQQVTNNHSNSRTFNTRSGENAMKSSPGEPQDQNIAEEDVRDWLEMTGFADPTYRKTALARFRKIRALDAQRAELEREAQLEIEGRSYIARGQSALPRESVEATVSHTNISPKIIRTIQSMPPPPLPTKDAVDDIGIKIKDSANREGPSSVRTVEDDSRASRKIYEQNKTRSLNLKRPYVDDESDARNGRPAEKLTRVDTRGSTDFKIDSSPTASRGQWSLENRITRHDGTFERVKSRSPDSRHRSVSPIRGRTSNYEKYVPPRSRVSPIRRNGYSPDRQANIEKTKSLENLWCWQCQQSGHQHKDCTVSRKRRDNEVKESSSYEDSHSLPYAHKKGEIKAEHEQDGQFWGDYQASTMRPFTGHNQHYQFNNYRGRGRGRGGYPFANNRGGYRPYRPVDGAQDAQFSGSSASLNLRAGDSRYFMIKSWNSENVEIAQRDCTWATQEKNLAVLTEAYNSCRNVILVFSINNSRAFQGYARMSSLPGDAPTPSWAKHLIWDATPPFHIQWITIAETRFNRVGHLKNILNEGQAVLVGRDGQEIEGECGRMLCELIDEEGKINGAWSGKMDWGRGTENETET